MAILCALIFSSILLVHSSLALTTQVTPLKSRPGGPGSNGCSNTPQTRGCWKGDFDIYADYDTKIPQGRLREVCYSSFLPLDFSFQRLTHHTSVPSHGYREADCGGWLSCEQDRLQWCDVLAREERSEAENQLLTSETGQYPGPLIEADWGDTIRKTLSFHSMTPRHASQIPHAAPTHILQASRCTTT